MVAGPFLLLLLSGLFNCFQINNGPTDNNSLLVVAFICVYTNYIVFVAFLHISEFNLLFCGIHILYFSVFIYLFFLLYFAAGNLWYMISNKNVWFLIRI